LEVLITLTPRSGLDNGVMNKMHYYQDSRNEWFYSDGGIWYYDDIAVPTNTKLEMVDEMRENLNHEDAGLGGDAEMEKDEEKVTLIMILRFNMVPI